MSNKTETSFFIQELFFLSQPINFTDIQNLSNQTVSNDNNYDTTTLSSLTKTAVSMNVFLNFLYKYIKLNRIIVLLSFIAFVLNLICIVIFKKVFSFKVKYNVYLIFGPVTDCVCSVLFQVSYLSMDLISNYDIICYMYTYIINPIGYTFYCLSLTISLIISIDRLALFQMCLYFA